jgi:3-oxoacyl-[acyl-carrier protein] reductase
MKLKGKVAIITGAARGIGFAIAETLAQNGVLSVIIDLNKNDVDCAVQKIDDAGFKAIGYACDVTDSENLGNVFKDIHSKFEKIDILVNNAGITRDGLLMKMKEADWDAVINVNLKGTFNCIQKVSRFMLKQKSGVIINISSVVGIMGNPGQANYAASKGGIIALTKSAAKEFASRNIRVNAIAPGFIQTGTVKDIANLCVFLASKEAKYITGQTINVDGGLVM